LVIAPYSYNAIALPSIELTSVIGY
jgi:hypothetical protein